MRAQLRIRTQGSFQEVYGPIDRVVERLKEIGCEYAACVDMRGSTWMHVKWASYCKEAGIIPMFGAELIVRNEDYRPTCWVLAEDTRELYKATSRGFRNKFWGATTTEEDMANSTGLIRFAGAALTDPATFDYIDVNPASAIQRAKSLALAKKTKKPVVFTSDNYYPSPAEQNLFNLLGRSKKPTPQYIIQEPPTWVDKKWLRTADEIAERLSNVKLHTAPMIHLDGDIVKLAEVGKKYRLKMKHIVEWTPEYEARLQREIAMIKEKDFDAYFLVVADLIAWAKERMLVGPARGSSAGSLFCYLTGITEVDPIPHKLIFERFIDVTRKDLPDIDIDFPDSKRDLVYDYLRDKYGGTCVARIGNVNTYKPNSALVVIGKALGIPAYETTPVKNAMFVRSSGDSRANNCLQDTIEQTEPGKEFLSKYPQVIPLLAIEGHASHTGVHAAGVIVCNEPIEHFATVQDGVLQLDKKDAEKLNLLKIDALGLRTLSVIEDAHVFDDHRKFYDLKFDDPEVYKIFNERKFSGIFQWEGQALQSVTSQMRIGKFADLDHITALARPGPLGGGSATRYIYRHEGKETFDYPHPSMGEYLDETFGLVIYQEQVLRMCREIGQMSWDDATLLRKAMSKSYGKEYFDQFGEKFVAGAATLGVPNEAAWGMWDMINSMGMWCLSGETEIVNPYPNHATPKVIKLKDLAANRGFTGPHKRQQIHSLDVERGVIVPMRCIDAFAVGEKTTYKMALSDGKFIRATAEHRFLREDGEWVELDRLCVGERIAVVGKRRPTERKQRKGTGSGGHNWWHKLKAGKPLLKRQIKILKEKFSTCQCCGTAPYEETHHQNGDHEDHRLENLLPVCRSCHTKLHGYAPPNSVGKQVEFAEITSIGEPLLEEVFDVSMPGPHHNFAANGIIAHNCFNKAHSVSYAIISYWTAWLKAHHPLQYTAAALRNAKDDSSVVSLLREHIKEGGEYIPFDIDKSKINWSVQDGKLVGGFMNLFGFGPAKAMQAISKRAAGTLNEKDIERIAKAKNKFEHLYPIRTAYKEFYDDPESKGIAAGWRITELNDMPSHGEVLLLGKLIAKDLRDENEAIRIQRRGGKRRSGQSKFVDFKLLDDSTTNAITVRVTTRQYETIGEAIIQKAIEGEEVFLIRGHKIENYPMVKINKIKCLTNPELFK